MNHSYQPNYALIKKWLLIPTLFFMGFSIVQAQTFYKTYTSPGIVSSYANVDETPGGFEIQAGGINIDGFNFTTINTDGDGNKLSDDELLINDPGSRANAIKLEDGTYVIGFTSGFGDPVSQTFYKHYDANGNLLHEFDLIYPAGAGILSRPCLYQLPNGNLYFIAGYSEDDPTGPPEMRHFVYSEYDLNTQQFVFSNDVLWSTSTIEASCVGIQMGGDGKLIVYIYESQNANKHLMIKQELDGTEIWRSTVSTLERPVRDFEATPEGGVWYWNSYFNSLRYLNPDGSFGGSFDLFAFQNSIQGSATIKGIVGKSDNNVLVVGSADPASASQIQAFTATVGTDGTTITTNLFDLPGPIPARFDGSELSGGGYALAGGLSSGATNFTPFLLKLDADGNLNSLPSIIDLEVGLTGTTASPDIWSLHSVTLDIVNDGNIAATGVKVHIPQAAGSVFQGGNEYSATQGTFNPFGSNEWNVGTLPAGGTASITINYFRTSESQFFQYAQVVAANEADFDSVPDNGDGSTVNEDDESVYGSAGGIDFWLNFISADIEAAAVGNNLEFSFFYGAIYPLSAFDATVTTSFYLSLDGEVSSDDIFLTSDITTFTENQSTSKNISVQVPTIAPGEYNLIGKIDAPEEFAEPNEDNNTIAFPNNYEQVIITPPTGNLPDLIGSRPFGSNPQGGYDIGDNITSASFDLYNTGTATSGTIQIGWYISTDQTLSPDDIFLNERDFGPTQILHFSPQFTSAPTLTIPAGTPSGDYWILIFVDSDLDITESTESNNIRPSINQITINGSGNPCAPDIVDPVINGCPGDIPLTTSGNSAVATWFNPTATDNCSTPTLSSNFNSGDSFPLGTTTVTYVATDAAGNTSDCSFNVIVTLANQGGCSNSLLTNGGFENGLNGWNNRGGGSITSNAYAGSNALQICPEGESRVIQSVSVQGGTTYTLEFYGSNDLPPLNSTGSATVKFLTSSWQPLPNNFALSIPSDWQLLSHDFVAPANAAYAEINFRAPSNACIFIDEVCFAESGGGPADCVLSIDVTNITCDDSGTPNDPSDDTFTYDYTVNSTGNCGSEWETPFGGFIGQYGEVYTINPLLISAGAVTISVRDRANSGSIATTFVIPPAPCSNGGGGQQADLTLSNLNAPSSAQVGDVINYNFDLQNIGNADASGSFSIKAYFSTDNVLSSDDIFDGIVPTGNLGAGQAVSDVPGASTIPSLSAGNYYLILKVDADDQITESDENNNTISSAIAITVGGGGTPNCEADSDFPWHEWISNVKIGANLDQASGKSTYSDFTGTPFDLSIGSLNNVALTASYSYFTHDEYWRVWIDLNQDDIFDASEIMFEIVINAPMDGTASATTFGNFTIPSSAATGHSKMRVIMRRDGYADPCGSIDFGEVEDYMVNILPNNSPNNRMAQSAAGQMEVKVFPNPANDAVSVVLGNKADRAEEVIIVNHLGKIVYTEKLEATAFTKTLFIDISDLITGTYFLQVNGSKMKPISKRLMIQKDY